jgi:acetyl-CoA carboxylase biotin carboxyl carrier protein
MIDIRKLKELVRLMVANELTELDLRDSEEQVSLRRQSPMVPGAHAPVVASHPVMNVAPPAGATPASGAEPAAPTGEDDGHRIESPMVGTFYTAPNPDAPPFIKVGDHVGADSVVCIVEAMKIFNEIKAGCAGTVQKVLVSNGESVEFGQPLFLVKSN